MAAIVFAPEIAAWAASSSFAAATSVAIAQGAVGGAIVGYVVSKTVQGTVTGGLSGALFGGIGDLGFTGVEKVLAHAAGGCAMGAATGGDCGSGALAAGAGAALGPAFSDLGRVGEGVARAAMGGTFSVLGGGKFANGAITAAYGYLFNDMAHSRDSKVTLYGRYAAGVGDTACIPECLHLSVVASDSYYGATLLEGQPTGPGGVGKISARQLSEFQKDSVFSVDLPVPEGMTARGFAQALTTNAGAFANGALTYRLPYLPFGYLPGGQYNSNSFASGLLQSVYGSTPKVFFGNRQAPGWGNPIPRRYFGGGG